MGGKMKVLVTGWKGFIGKNLIVNLSRNKEIEILKFGRENTIEELKRLIKEADFIYHLAGVNRPKNEEEFNTVNVGLTRTIVEILLALNKKLPIVMSSSIQAALDNPYGRSKKAAEEILIDYRQRTGADVYIYRLSNVFGKWERPNYNSVVATFCYNIVHDKEIWVSDETKEVELVYIDDVVKEFVQLLSERKGYTGYLKVMPVFKVTLGELATKIRDFHENRKRSIVPNFSDEFTKKLYSTYMSYFEKDRLSQVLELKKDERGELFELIKSKCFGQIFVSTTRPGIVRGNHFHDSKVEKFCLVKGEAKIKLRNILTGEEISYNVSDKKIEVVDIPPGYTHSIENIGNEDMIVLFWANELFDPDNPDTYYEKV
jgi:UDP-2-acetamido-2,6-beta-L-arabino-hexul-4-ose reductase